MNGVFLRNYPLKKGTPDYLDLTTDQKKITYHPDVGGRGDLLYSAELMGRLRGALRWDQACPRSSQVAFRTELQEAASDLTDGSFMGN